MTSYLFQNKSLVIVDKRAELAIKRVDFADRCVAPANAEIFSR
jgi:hypothetical protein